MRRTLPLICSFLMMGCLGPKVPSCIFDFNVIDRAIKSEKEPLTKDGVLLLLANVTPWYCVPPDAKDDKHDFQMPMKTGWHGYSPKDWGILMRWIEDHKK